MTESQGGLTDCRATAKYDRNFEPLASPRLKLRPGSNDRADCMGRGP